MSLPFWSVGRPLIFQTEDADRADFCTDLCFLKVKKLKDKNEDCHFVTYSPYTEPHGN